MSSKKEKHAEPEAAEHGEGGDGEAAPKKGKKLIVIIAAVVLLGAVGAGLVLSGVLGGKKKVDPHAEGAEGADAGEHGDAKAGEGEKEGEHGAEAGKVDASKPVYYELPQFLVNLNSATSRASFLKMGVTLELKNQAAVAIVEANKPRIVDTFNTYLRELRASDVQGSAGIYRLRDELMARINATVQEGLVKDILFSEIIVQ